MTSQRMEMSRRRLMQATGLGAAGVAGAGLLSACKADGTSGGDGERRGRFVATADMNPVENHKNPPFSDGALLIGQAVAPLFYPKVANYNWGSQEYIPMLAESLDVDLDGKLITVKLREGVKWTDGNEVTAKDLAGSYRMAYAGANAANTLWPYVDEINETDDYTVELVLNHSYEGIGYIAGETQVHSSARYGDFMERAKGLMEQGTDVWGSGDQESFNSDLADLDFDDWISCGPYKFEEQTDNQVIFKHHEGGLFADEVLFDEVIARAAGNSDVVPFMKSGEVDYSTHVLNPNDRDVILEDIDGSEQLQHGSLSGGGIALNNNRHPELADYRVRKAILHALDREAIGVAARGEGGFLNNTYDSGCAILVTEDLLDDPESKLTHYDYDVDKAAELMEEAGWSKQDGKWAPEGEDPKSYTLVAPDGWDDWTDTAIAVADQLQEFGLDVEFQTVPESSVWAMWPSGEYDMTIRHWGNPLRPQYSGAAQFNFFWENDRTDESPGMGVETKDIETEAYGTVNVDDIYDDAVSASDPEKLREANAKLAVIFNETLPRLPIWEEQHTSHYVVGDRLGEVTVNSAYDENNPTKDNPLILGILTGDVKPA
ncbi:ABC transporter substrate-binding protein [Haloglycomyces albus]|uniref:ABC transporter substrate-binding protein n=1 Tax=Haloglycomyces albus TaxID=526067 RepID=UPI00046CB8B0|nr:ABC transporter substrate-binding protein [Haloglycomyces albus]